MKLQLQGEMELDLGDLTRNAHEWIDGAKIDPGNLTHQMAEQPGMFAYYGAVAAYAKHKLANAKTELEALEAEVSREIRDRYRAAGEKVALKTIEVEMAMDERIQAMREQVRDVRLQSDLCTVAAKSYEHRLSMLMSIGAMERAEINGLNPQIRTLDRNNDDRVRDVTRKSVPLHFSEQSPGRDSTPSASLPGKPRRS